MQGAEMQGAEMQGTEIVLELQDTKELKEFQEIKDKKVLTIQNMFPPLEKSLFSNDKIELCDEEDGLELLCYTDCDNSCDEITRSCRGIVYDDEKMVFRGYSYTPEYTNQEYYAICNEIQNIEQWRFFESHEGTLLRMFYYKNKWYLATHRKLDAFNSRWSSKSSFGLLFEIAISHQYNQKGCFYEELVDLEGESVYQKFLKYLDKEKKYMFLVRTNEENRIVCTAPPNAQVFHVGTINRNGDFIVGNSELYLPTPKEIKFSSVKELCEKTSSINIYKIQGHIGFSQNGQMLKVTNNEYLKLFQLRGNRPSLRFRYLELRMDKGLRKEFLNLYQEKIGYFEECENRLYLVAKELYSIFVRRVERREYVKIEIKDEFTVIQIASGLYNGGKGEKITIETIIRIMNKLSPTILNHMIKRHVNAELGIVRPQKYKKAPFVKEGLLLESLRRRQKEEDEKNEKNEKNEETDEKVSDEIPDLVPDDEREDQEDSEKSKEKDSEEEVVFPTDEPEKDFSEKEKDENDGNDDGNEDDEDDEEDERNINREISTEKY